VSASLSIKNTTYTVLELNPDLRRERRATQNESWHAQIYLNIQDINRLGRIIKGVEVDGTCRKHRIGVVSEKFYGHLDESDYWKV